ncbi:hypothetical protein MFIFM68171_10078 [Madurella fahalii]|uniref:C2H2-type domain-containing protein n=1 Tax=Madurella fahalii TaxID=1157608 RepID=A0ABQ0GQ49_9PEZI
MKRTRNVLEQLLFTARTDNDLAKTIEKYYEVYLYKCLRLSCKYFSNGFATKEQGDQHLEKHRKPFQCTVAGYPSLALGLSSERDLKKHMKVAHSAVLYENELQSEDEILAEDEIRDEDEIPDEDEVNRRQQQAQFSNAIGKLITWGTRSDDGPAGTAKQHTEETATRAQVLRLW